MKDLASNLVENPSCCPTLTFKQRLYGFFITFSIGILLSILSCGSLIQLFKGNARPFAIFYTLGNIITLSSSFFLYGPKRQCKSMLEPKRLIASIIYVSALIATILVAIFFNKLWGLIVALIIIQFAALSWYLLSYIPYGREMFVKCLKCCCCDKTDQDKQSPLV